MMMMINASLMWGGAAEKPEQFKMTFKNHQNESKQLTKFNLNQIKNTEAQKICYQMAFDGLLGRPKNN